MKTEYPLTRAQKELWLSQSKDLKNPAFNTSEYIVINEKIDENKMMNSLHDMITSTESLHFNIVENGQGIYQKKHDKPLNISWQDFSTYEKSEEIALKWMKEDAKVSINLEIDYWYKASLVKINDNKYFIYQKIHHIATDGFSYYLMAQNLSKLYRNEVNVDNLIENNKISTLIKEDEEYTKSEMYDRDKEYWVNQFSDSPNIPVLGDKESEKIAPKPVRISQSLTNENIDIPHPICYIATFVSYISYIKGTKDITLGMPFMARLGEKSVNIPGMKMTILPLRIQIDDTDTINSLSSKILEKIAEIKKYQGFRSEELKREIGSLNLPRVYGPIINIMPFDYNIKFESQPVKKINISVGPVEDLSINILYSGNRSSMDLDIDANKYLYINEDIQNHFLRVENVFNNLDKSTINKPINKLHFLSKEDEKKVESYETSHFVKFDETESVKYLFERCTKDNESEIAIKYKEVSLTYKELNAYANRIAHTIRNMSTENKCQIAIIMDSSIEMIASILAVLKNGFTYVPITPNFPEQRIQYILNDANVSMLITDNEQMKKKYSQLLTLDLNSISLNEDNLEVITNIEDAAYIIYTSGSTGNPKGVRVTNRGPVKVHKHFEEYNLINETDNFPQFSTVSFDAACLEIYTTLLSGATLVIPTKEEKQDPLLYEKFINENNITLALFPPAYANQLHPNNIETLKILITGGSATNITLVNNWKDKVRYFNVYGPTENSIISTIWEPENDFEDISIGIPLTNDILQIVNDKNQKLPPGVPGEILLGGMGLMKEYVNLYSLTKEKVILVNGRKMYKTGDIGLWDEKGNVKYLGRVDDQVKIRGFRIELQEIEKNIESITEVLKAHVISKNYNNQDELVAYFTSEKHLSLSYIKKTLSNKLPNYMVPANIIQLDNFPVNHNGKIDNNRLPMFEDVSQGEEFSPKKEQEQVLFEIWKEVLDAPKIYKNLSFYDLGGDSIKAIQVTAKLRQHGMKLSVSDLLETPFIKELSKKIERLNLSEKNSNDTGDFSLSPVQLWFLESNLNKNYFNQSILLKIEDSITIEKMNYALNQIVKNHSVLRSEFYYSEVENKTKQIICDYQPDYFFKFKNIVVSGKNEMEKMIEESQQEIDLHSSELIKGLFIYDEEKKEKYVFLTIHHLIIDLVSWRIILDDFSEILEGAYDESSYWKYQTDSYESWIENLNNYPVAEETSYWKSIMSEKTDYIDLDTNNHLVSHKNDEEYELILNNQQTKDLLYHVNSAYNTTINHILLATLSNSLWEWKNLTNILVNLESHGRDAYNESVNNSRTVGWFTSQYPIILQRKEEIENHLIETKDKLNFVPHNGIGYGVSRYMTHEDIPNYSSDISFNYFGKVHTNSSYSTFNVIKLPDSRDTHVENLRDFKLNIYGYQTEDNIVLKFNFSTLQFKRDTIKKLSECFENSLDTILNLCKSKKESELTSSDLKLLNINSEELNIIKKDTKQLGNIEDIYPLTPMQRGMLYHNKKDEKDPYYDQIWFDISGELDVDMLVNEIELVLKEEDVLKTNIYENQLINQPLQIITKKDNQVIVEDLSNISFSKANEKIKLDLEQEKNRDINLYNDKLITIKIYKFTEKKHKIVLFFHHIIMDGWSVSLLIKKFLSNYEKEKNNKQKEKNPKFKNYLSYLTNKNTKVDKEFWENYLKDFETHTKIPYESSSNISNYEPRRLEFNLGSENTTNLKKIANVNNITLNALMNTLWGVLLQQYNTSSDVAFGTVVSGRSVPLDSIEDMIGLLINTVPIRVKSNEEYTFLDLAKKVNSDLSNIKDKETYPLYEIQNISNMKQNLISHIFLFENQPTSKKLEIGNLSVDNFDGQEQTNYNFNVKVTPSDNIKVQFDYNSNVISEIEVKKIKSHLISINEKIIKKPDILIKDITYIDDNDVAQWKLLNSTERERQFSTIPDIFQNVVKRYPDYNALVFDDIEINYNYLNSMSNKIANYLLENEITHNSTVPVVTEKNIFTIATMIAIVKIGAIYVPIDNTYPDERKEFILSDINPKLVLISNEKHTIPNSNKYMLVNSSRDLNWDKLSSNLTSTKVSEESIAYIIYTSGTTGTPKGVKITHSNIMNLNLFFSNEFNMNEKDNVAQFANLSFDASLWEIFSALLNGGTLVIPKEEEAIDYNLFENFINKNKITALSLTPAFATYLKPEKLPSLKKVVTSGSATSKDLVKKWKNHVSYYNGYGPTENTICTTMWLANDDYNSNTVPIGKPIPNNRLYILNHNQQIQPIGVPGELCIAGESLSPGYLNQKEITTNKFISPMHLEEKRIYYTGDFAKLLPDGDIEFLGRKDNQIKIRGFRIEIGEIEEALMNISYIKEVVVVPNINEKGNNSLSAYYVSFDDSITSNMIKDVLKGKLPGFMIPSYFIQMKSMPYNHSGKIDKNNLPKIKNRKKMDQNITEVSTPTQAILRSVWEEILEVKHLDLYDDLFNEGLHSIKVLEGLSKIESTLKVRLRYKDITENPTILELETRINQVQNWDYDSQNSFSAMSQGDKIIFAFPTGLGLGITFNELTNYINGYATLYTTDFDDKDKDYDQMIDSYIDDMYEINKNNSYNILGYCAGGNLSFELVRRMEERGFCVNKLILLDTTIRNNYINSIFKDKSYLDDAQNQLPYWANNIYTRKSFKKFKNYLDQLNNQGIINANIHHIRVPSETDEYKSWSEFTAGNYEEYCGIGSHDTLLANENVHENSKIIMSIINNEKGKN